MNGIHFLTLTLDRAGELYRAMNGDAELAVTAEQAARVIRVIELARRSNALTRTVDWPADGVR